MFFRIFHKKKEKVEETQIILNICKSLREILYLQSGIKDNSTIRWSKYSCKIGLITTDRIKKKNIIK